MLVIAGICLSRILQPILFPIPIGQFSIDLGHLGILALTFFSTWVYFGGRSRWVWLLLGISFDQLLYLAVKANHLTGLYSIGSIIGSLILLGVSLAVYSLLTPRPPCPDAETHDWFGWGRILCFGVIMLLVIGGFRLAQVAALGLGIPNEERSLMLWGYEIHHINIGVLLIYLTIVGLYYGIGGHRTKTAIFILLAVGIALVNDQIVYYALEDVSDAGYSGTESWLGAVVVSAAQGVLIIGGRFKNRTADQP